MSSDFNFDRLKELCLSYSNWYELGSFVRKEFSDLSKLYPNDYDLGKEVNKIIKNNC